MTRTVLDRLRPRGDGGFSLAELSVAMFISTLVAAAAAGMVNMSLQSSKASETRLTSINDARVSVESMSRSLRTAVLPRQLDNSGNLDNAFLQASPRRVFFYANINNPDNTIGPSQVTYEVTGGALVQTIQPPDPHGPTDHNYKYDCLPVSACAKSTRTLATGVTATQAVFRYFDTNGAELAFTATCSGMSCVSLANVENVDSVEVKVVLQPPVGVKIGSTTYVTRVALPNHDAVIREGSST